MFDKAWTVIKGHPYIAGVTVFLVGLVILYELGYFGGGSSSSGGGDQTMAAYYAAEAAAQQSGNALAAVHENNSTAVNLAQINAKAATDINSQNVNGNTSIATIMGDVTKAGYNASELIDRQNVNGAVTINKDNVNAAGQIAADTLSLDSFIAGMQGKNQALQTLYANDSIYAGNGTLLQLFAGAGLQAAGVGNPYIDNTGLLYTYGPYAPGPGQPGSVIVQPGKGPTAPAFPAAPSFTFKGT